MDAVEVSVDPRFRELETLRICINGYSASGKTVYARLLSQLLDVPLLSGSTTLLRALGVDPSDVDWIADAQRLDKIRVVADEKEADASLMREVASTRKCVIDSWVAPQLASVDLVKVWFECSEVVWVQNASFRFGGSRVHPLTGESILDGLRRKDAQSTERFRRLYGFDIRSQQRSADCVVDVSDVMSLDPTRWPAERRTILSRILEAVGGSVFGARSDERGDCLQRRQVDGDG